MTRYHTSNKIPDLLTESRESLVDSHVIHEFDLKRVTENLSGCYGKIMGMVYREMLPLINGTRVLDCGCGFGQFSQVAIDAGFKVTPIDIDDVSLAIASEISKVPCRKESAYSTTLQDNSCDTAVCCDSIQHLEIGHLTPELERIGVKRVIIYESNVRNPFLMLYHAITGHEESNERNAEEIVHEFRRFGYNQVSLKYENIVSLPFSGGLQRRPVLLLGRFPAFIHRMDRAFGRVARALKLDRWLAFRFVIVLQR